MTTLQKTEIIYPDNDGKPIADNTKQFRWIVTIQGGIDALFRDNPEKGNEIKWKVYLRFTFS